MADQVDVHIGTLSKAAGAHGGFVACRSDLRALLVTRGRAGVFSTALPAPVVAAAAAALRVAAEVRSRWWCYASRLPALRHARPRSRRLHLVLS